jgi:hypothetical protein
MTLHLRRPQSWLLCIDHNSGGGGAPVNCIGRVNWNVGAVRTEGSRRRREMKERDGSCECEKRVDSAALLQTWKITSFRENGHPKRVRKEIIGGCKKGEDIKGKWGRMEMLMKRKDQVWAAIVVRPTAAVQEAAIRISLFLFANYSSFITTHISSPPSSVMFIYMTFKVSFNSS